MNANRFSMDVSIIIVNYNTLSLTKSCIDSVFDKTEGIEVEVILVDNNSTDGSRDLFSADSRIKYIYNDTNLGFGRANNLGLSYAVGRNVLFLNSDTILINNAIKILSDYLDNNINVAGCGGNLYYEDLTPNMSFVRHYPSFIWEINALFHGIPSRLLRYDNSMFNFSNEPCPVAYIWGADLMIRKNLLDKYGAFDEDFFMYFEETELCHRLTREGYKIMSVPQAQIIHLNGKSTKQQKGPSKIYLESNFTYIDKTDTLFITRMLHRGLLSFRIFYHRLFGLWEK